MATADSVKGKLQGQIDKINAATGGTDTTLAGAVDTVISGFGQGGVDEEIFDAVALKNLSEYRNERITNIPQYCFSYWRVPLSVYFPNLQSADMYTFMTTGNLVLADLGFMKAIRTYAFYGNGNLSTVILRGAEVCALTGFYEFDKTPFAVGGTGGTVYVPAALIESYQTATNWVTLYEAGTCNFVAIEGSEYE